MLTNVWFQISDNRNHVTFNPIVKKLEMVVWTHAYQVARISNWRQNTVDRQRFHKRICEMSWIISPILTIEHREKISERMNKSFEET